MEEMCEPNKGKGWIKRKCLMEKLFIKKKPDLMGEFTSAIFLECSLATLKVYNFRPQIPFIRIYPKEIIKKYAKTDL